MGGIKEVKLRTKSKKLDIEIEPHCWAHLSTLLESANSDPLRIIPKIKPSQVVNEALALYLGLRTEKQYHAQAGPDPELPAENASSKPFRQPGALARAPEMKKIELGPRIYVLLKAKVVSLNESPAHEHAPLTYSDIVNRALEDYLPMLPRE